MLARDDVTPEERAQAAAVVHRATSRMTRLLEDLLATARRARSGASSTSRSTCRRSPRQPSRRCPSSPPSATCGSRLRLDPGPVVIADAQALSRAIGNLLSNAVRLAPGGSEVTVASGSEGGWAWVAVRDEGPGIAEEDRDRVFHRFGRASGVDEDRGHGLGLAIARQVVEAHEGRIALYSELGSGAPSFSGCPTALAGSRERADAAPTGDPSAAAEGRRPRARRRQPRRHPGAGRLVQQPA